MILYLDSMINELEMVVSDVPVNVSKKNHVTDDEIQEWVTFIRNKELFVSPQSIFSVFAPMIINICGNNKQYKVYHLIDF